MLVIVPKVATSIYSGLNVRRHSLCLLMQSGGIDRKDWTDRVRAYLLVLVASYHSS
jgi:hypothetical protein